MRLLILVRRDSVDAHVAALNALLALTTNYSRGTVQEDLRSTLIQHGASFHKDGANSVGLKVIMPLRKSCDDQSAERNDYGDIATGKCLNDADDLTENVIAIELLLFANLFFVILITILKSNCFVFEALM